MIPTRYTHACVVMRQMPYSVAGQCREEAQPSSGTLEIGRVVWLDSELDVNGEERVDAYASGIGAILLDPAGLQHVHCT